MAKHKNTFDSNQSAGSGGRPPVGQFFTFAVIIVVSTALAHMTKYGLTFSELISSITSFFTGN